MIRQVSSDDAMDQNAEHDEQAASQASSIIRSSGGQHARKPDSFIPSSPEKLELGLESTRVIGAGNDPLGAGAHRVNWDGFEVEIGRNQHRQRPMDSVAVRRYYSPCKFDFTNNFTAPE